MCIAILNKGEKISKNHFENSWYNNPDGFGMSYVYNGEIRVFKSMSKKVSKLYDRYSRIYDRIDSPILLHFRISTGGKINLENCHPFYVNDNTVFMHNGIISGYGNSVINDTIEFNQKVLSYFTFSEIKNNKGLNGLIAETIGYSKLVFLASDKSTHIIKPELGEFDETGNWFSNESYCNYYDSYDSIGYTPSYGKKWSDTKYNTVPNVNKASKLENKFPSKTCESCLQKVSETEYIQEYEVSICKDCQEWFARANY